MRWVMTYERRLSDKIIRAHKQACDEDSIEVARILFDALEVHLTSIGGEIADKRKEMPELDEAFKLHIEVCK